MSPTELRPRVFISYARCDGEAAARELRTRLQAAGVPLWRDREGMEGGRDWWQQITAAIDQVEFLVLVISPAALQSKLVRREWRYARQRAVSVYPVMGLAEGGDAYEIDFASLPRWMRRVHFYNLRHEWLKFVNDLHTQPQRVRVPFMVEDFPEDFVQRPNEYEQLLSLLLDREREEPIAITTALRGAGGFGKTALARALCHDEEIQNAFDDGILWVTLGENPGDLTGHLEDLIYTLTGQRPGFTGLDAASAALAELLADREMLLVIDDAWDPRHVRPFLQGGPRCARLITTRRADVLPPRARRIDVDAMSIDEARALLGQGLIGAEHHADAITALARRLGEWPLLLKLVNAALLERLQERDQPLAQALLAVNEALDLKGLTHFDAADTSERHAAVTTTLGVSLAQLTEAHRQRLHELAVFPEDVEVPLPLVAALWARTACLDAIDTEELCARLARLSLLLSFDLATRTLRLHDVVRHFLIGRLGERMPELHRTLLDAGRPHQGAWADMPLTEGYWWNWLATHLHAGNRADELAATVLGLRYLARKTAARTALSAERDLALAVAANPGHATLAQLRRSFAQATHLLARCTGAGEVLATLLSRMAFVPQLEALVAACQPMAEPRLVPLAAPPDMPHPALVRTVGIHRGTVSACAISADGTRAATSDSEHLIRVWDVAEGKELRVIRDHRARALALSADGRVLAAATHDRRLVLWDTGSGRERLCCVGHVDALTGVALNLAQRRVLTSSLDGTLKLWDTDSGALLHTLGRTWGERDGGWMEPTNDQGHWSAVQGCAISACGRWLASASSDQTVVVWDAHNGRALQVLQAHEAGVNACAFSPDGTQLATGGGDAVVLLWDWEAGTHRLLAGHEDAVTALAWSHDGHTVVSASADCTLRLWDPQARRTRTTYTGHTDWVVGCGIASAAGLVVSASIDGSARLWDLSHADSAETGRVQPARWVRSCAAVPSRGQFFTTAGDRGLERWRWRSRARVEALRGHEGTVTACAVSADERLVASASTDKTLIVWDAASGRALQTLVGHRDWVNACSFDAAGTVLASASNDRTLRLWDMASRARRLAFVAHKHWVTACAVSPDGRWVFSGGGDGTIRRWPLAEVDESLWEAWIVRPRELSGEAADAMLRPKDFKHHQRSVNHMAVAADGQWMAAASSDATLSLWDAQDGRQLHLLQGHGADVMGCSFSPDAQHLCSVAIDGSVKVWDMAAGRCCLSLQLDGELAGCVWSGKPNELVVVGAMGVYFLACSGLGVS